MVKRSGVAYSCSYVLLHPFNTSSRTYTTARTPTPRPASHSKHSVARTKTDTSCNFQCNVSSQSALWLTGFRSEARRGQSVQSIQVKCSRSTPRPESHSFLPSRAQGLFEHVEEFEKSTSALPRTSYASVYSRDHAVHDRSHVPPAAPFVPAPEPTISNAVFESFWRKTNACDVRRQKANEGHTKGTLRPTKAPWQVRLWVPSRRSGQPVPTPTWRSSSLGRQLPGRNSQRSLVMPKSGRLLSHWSPQKWDRPKIFRLA